MDEDEDASEARGLTEAELEESERGYIDRERHASVEEAEEGSPHDQDGAGEAERKGHGGRAADEAPDTTVDVVLSDMFDPWPQTTGFHKRSLSQPYLRMMNTSGIPFRDHAGSMVSFFSFFFGFLRPSSLFPLFRKERIRVST